MKDDPLVADFMLTIRVESIFERYCRDGKRPTREEATAWLQSLGWKQYGLANLLNKWGYDEKDGDK